MNNPDARWEPDAFEMTKPPADKMEYIASMLPDMLLLAQRLKDAQDLWKEQTDIVAMKADISSAALRSFVKGKAQDDPSKVIGKKHAESEDFCLLADEIK